MSVGSAEYGHIDHFMVGVAGLYGEPAAEKIKAEFARFAEGSRSKTLNKWQIAYIAEEVSRRYYGFDLYVVGYFGDGDSILDFNNNELD